MIQIEKLYSKLVQHPANFGFDKVSFMAGGQAALKWVLKRDKELTTIEHKDSMYAAMLVLNEIRKELEKENPMIKSFTPLSDKVLVQRLKSETSTPGGIALPTKFVEKSDRGKVIKVGKGRILDDGSIRKMEVKEGDLVLFSPGTVAEVQLDGEKYLVMSELSIIAKF